MADTAASLGGACFMPAHQAAVTDQRAHATPPEHTRFCAFLVFERLGAFSPNQVGEQFLCKQVRIDNHHFGQGLAQLQGEDRPWEICRREVQN